MDFFFFAGVSRFLPEKTLAKSFMQWGPDDNLTGLNGFLDPQIHGVGTKITTLQQTMTDLL